MIKWLTGTKIVEATAIVGTWAAIALAATTVALAVVGLTAVAMAAPGIAIAVVATLAASLVAILSAVAAGSDDGE